MGRKHRLTIEEMLAIHKQEQARHLEEFIIVNPMTDHDGEPVVIRHPRKRP